MTDGQYRSSPDSENSTTLHGANSRRFGVARGNPRFAAFCYHSPMNANPRLALSVAAACSFLSFSAILAQPTSRSPLAPPANGPARNDSTWVALSDCTVHTDPQTT